ncbi:phage baseplate assembly protein V [Acetobacter sacchari]|uniref:Phage baseplate assembly protein V n=1 Tax=Acetobacter sacchari TaxID=2661687 RepID=A0ABS3LXY2_9PROT|nr:phage baseplate assembly protein V [Acetobacter sacchari]
MSSLRSVLDMQMHAHASRIGRARLGVVSAVDPSAGLVKVRLQPENTETGWICDTAIAVGSTVCYAPSELGSHVLVETVQGDGDNYIVITRIFDAVSMPPTFSALGDAVLQAGQFGVKIADTEIVVSESGVTVVGPLIIRGDVSVQGTINAQGDISTSGVSLEQHIHRGVQSGSSVSGTPVSG